MAILLDPVRQQEHLDLLWQSLYQQAVMDGGRPCLI
jgi:hypothetical protein